MPKRSVSPGSWILAIAVLLCLIVYARSSFAADVSIRRQISTSADDLLFADGFGDDPCDGGCTPGQPVCQPPGPRTVETFNGPTVVDWAGTQSYASLPEVGADQLTQIKLQGGTWRAYSFTRADMPADLTELNADTSNPGPGAIGADAWYWSISECEGDFAPQAGCLGMVGEGPFAYPDFSGLRVSGVCPLDPSKTYFLNVHAGPNPCNSTRPGLCGFRVKLLPR